MIFQSTGPLRGPTLLLKLLFISVCISIHRPLAGPDLLRAAFRRMQQGFQSTGPLRGPTRLIAVRHMMYALFQSTGPLRGPTSSLISRISLCQFQSTGPLRGPTIKFVFRAVFTQFQSTGPLRGPTGAKFRIVLILMISIHRPLAGPDRSHRATIHTSNYFNPQAPCGARPCSMHLQILMI